MHMLNKMGMLAAMFLSLTLANACSPAGGTKKMDAPKKVVDKKEASASGIVLKPGFYQDKNVGFTFTWPAKIMSEPAIKLPGEVLRWRSKKGIPVVTVTVKDKTENTASLQEAPQFFKKRFASMLKEGRKFELVEGEITTISNGVQAAYARINWEIGKQAYKMVTVSITVYKDDKIIVVTCTAPQEFPPIEIINNWVKAIKVDV